MKANSLIEGFMLYELIILMAKAWLLLKLSDFQKKYPFGQHLFLCNRLIAVTTIGWILALTMLAKWIFW